MKYNEPIRPAGIGRKQVAFPTGNQTSELQSLEIDFNTIANDSTGSQIEARISNAIGIAKSSATAAASGYGSKTQKALTEISNRLIKISERVRSLGE